MQEPESYVVAAFDVTTETRVTIKRVVTPRKPVVLKVVSKKGVGAMATRTNTIQLSPVDPAAAVTSRPCQVVFSDGSPTLNVDMQDPAATFPAEDGQALTVTALGDINTVGQGPPSDPFPYTVAVIPPPPVVPVKPTVLGVTSV
jgi:hypothetical protein